MQNYYSVQVSCTESSKELLMAVMETLGYEGFLETENGFDAYIQEENFNESLLNESLWKYGSQHKPVITLVPPQNWNEAWESSFEPVLIGEQIRIRAPFHEKSYTHRYDLVIMPKTSFGTGHHETTFTILSLMEKISFDSKKVLDFGSGTGILAIFAAKLGASQITANDIDTWAAQNIKENAELNSVEYIKFFEGGLEITPGSDYDIILANINRNILAEKMNELASRLNKNGKLLISGFFESDLPYLDPFIRKAGLLINDKQVKNNWCSAILIHQ